MLCSDERGSVTAEFAITLPAVLAIIGLIFGALYTVTLKITLTSGAFDIARLEAREDSELAAVRIAQLPAGTGISRAVHDQILCVTITKPSSIAILDIFSSEATGCAALQQSSW